jgi:CheY-like chemotaxis protein
MGSMILTERPSTARILIVEDDEPTAEMIRFKLSPLADKVVHRTVATATDAKAALAEESFHAVSVDCTLMGGLHSGPAVLKAIATAQPTAGRMVYAQCHQQSCLTFLREADEFLPKNGAAPEAFEEGMSRVIRLGYRRKIHGVLASILKPEQLPDFASVNDDVTLRSLSRQAAQEDAGSDNGRRALLALLHERGWWRLFVAAEFARKGWSGRLAELLGYVGITPAELASVIRLPNTDVAQELLDGTTRERIDVSALEGADRLLSILSYLLQLSAYQPERMKEHWVASGTYARSSNKPPWNDLGLREYLIRQGPAGLEESLVWIRSH